jgi:hypothetical protein
MSTPPDDLPVYRVLTGPDDAKFCRRVSEALALGYVLYGSPAERVKLFETFFSNSLGSNSGFFVAS